MVQSKAQNTYAQIGNYLMWFTRLRGRPDEKELAEKEASDPEAKDNELLLFQRLLENYSELPFYKFAELFQLVGRNLKDEDYQRLVTFAFHKQGNLDIHGRTENV